MWIPYHTCYYWLSVQLPLGCHAQHLKNPYVGKLFTEEVKQELFKEINKPYCNTHWNQMNNVGFCYKTQYERNDIEIFDTYAEIILRNKHGQELTRAIIDIDDVEKVKNIKWRLSKRKHTSYVYGFTPEKRVIKLHRLITDCPDNLVVDHINHNGLDNRKINLKVCTTKENNQNLRKSIK